MGNVSYTSRASISCFRSVCFCYTLPQVACRFVQRLGVCLERLVQESVSLFGGWGVSFTSPLLETVWSFVREGVGGESLLHALCSSLSGVSSGEETLFQALYWNLSHRCWNLPGHTSDGDFILHAQSWNLSRCLASGESLLHAPK